MRYDVPSPLLILGQMLHGSMLWWALAASIPILIHLLSRRRYRETSWAAMQFLLAALRKQSRRMRIEQLLLLLLRVLILILLALALAEPLLPGGGTAGSAASGGGRTHWVLVLDASFSMDYRQDDKTLFDRAREAAKQLVAGAEQGDGFTLLLLTDPPQVIIREPAFDTSDVTREIDALTIRHGGADLTAGLIEVQSIVEQGRRRHPRLSDTQVCLFSDLGRTTWAALDSAASRKLLAELAQIARLNVLEFGSSVWQNAAVTRLEMVDSLATVDREVRFLCEVRRLSSDAPRTARAEILVDGQLLREEEADLAGGADTMSFSYRFATPGDHAVEVRLRDADPLDVDNHRWQTVVVRDSVQALCVEGQSGAARYVSLALEPRRTERPRVRWEVVPEASLRERELAGYDCVFLCNVARMTEEEAGVLRSFVRSGGGLIVFLGNQVQADDYHRKLVGSEKAARLLPAQIHSLVTVDQGVRFDPLGYKHPLVQPFQEHERAGLLTTPTWRYFRLEPIPDSKARVALAYDNGDPALIEETIGRGRVFLFAGAATPQAAGHDSWTEFPTWPSFPPVIQEIVGLAIRQADTARTILVGETLESFVPHDAASTTVLVTNPLGDSERVRIRSSRDEGLPGWQMATTWWSGIYRAQRDDSGSLAELFAVNVDNAESQLDRVDATQLPTQLHTGLPVPDEAAAMPADPQQAASVSRYLLAALLVLVLLETFFAWQFGTSRQ
jgi:hypothetical protein